MWTEVACREGGEEGLHHVDRGGLVEGWCQMDHVVLDGGLVEVVQLPGRVLQDKVVLSHELLCDILHAWLLRHLRCSRWLQWGGVSARARVQRSMNDNPWTWYNAQRDLYMYTTIHKIRFV